ncbi:4Fe-4S ferredoxin, partial [Candidatus Aerophobetes bacterium]
DGRVITKCDLCLERIKEDRNPICVESCPTGVLQYKTIDEITAEKRKETVKDFLVAFEKSQSKKKSKE